MGTSDEDFLSDIESRADEYVEYFTEQETYRLWRMCGYVMPSPNIRKYYLQGRVLEFVSLARRRIKQQVIERLTL